MHISYGIISLKYKSNGALKNLEGSMLDSTYIISDTKTIRSFQVEMCLSDADPFVASAAQTLGA